MCSPTDVLSYDLLHFGKKRRDILPRGFDQELPIRIAPDVLSKEVEAVPHVRDYGLFWRKDQTPLYQWDGRSGRWCSPDNHTCDFMSRPLVEPVSGNQTAAALERLPERGLGADRL